MQPLTCGSQQQITQGVGGVMIVGRKQVVIRIVGVVTIVRLVRVRALDRRPTSFHSSLLHMMQQTRSRSRVLTRPVHSIHNIGHLFYKESHNRKQMHKHTSTHPCTHANHQLPHTHELFSSHLAGLSVTLAQSALFFLSSSCKSLSTMMFCGAWPRRTSRSRWATLRSPACSADRSTRRLPLTPLPR